MCRQTDVFRVEARLCLPSFQWSVAWGRFGSAVTTWGERVALLHAVVLVSCWVHRPSQGCSRVLKSQWDFCKPTRLHLLQSSLYLHVNRETWYGGMLLGCCCFCVHQSWEFLSWAAAVGLNCQHVCRRAGQEAWPGHSVPEQHQQ